MSWKDTISSEITRLEDYRIHNLPGDITRANQPASTAQKDASNRIKANFLAYQNVNKQLTQIIRQSTPQDLGATLSEIGKLQQTVAGLKSDIKRAKVDLETAEERDKQMKLSPPQTSDYQGSSTWFGITRPLKFATVPILFGTSIFLSIATILLLKEYFLLGIHLPTAGHAPGLGASSIGAIIRDPRIWATLFGASLIVILFLSLRIANKLPVLPA